MNDESWTFPLSEVQITDQILGRGAFGEVRVGRWRNILVACKRLHNAVVDSEGHDDSNAFKDMKQEISILSQLRHPNLVLFLGVCSDTTQGTAGFPSVILTELMPCSLYDILEMKKIKLSMAEILDISLDITYGLQYLHNYNPAIIHRDISSKNILIGGNRAKIADLGQAKIFGSSALSRQTSMPGAFAYSAPEVMTGRYSTKIDVFSFGVLLIQLVLSEYPRIEKREEQLQKACELYPHLASIMIACVSFQPNDRPNIEGACEALEIIRSNDRYYPPARRLPPQSDLGVLARKWMNDQIDSSCLAVNVQFELNSKTLLAEQRRLVEEVIRSDILDKKVKEMELALQAALTSLDVKDSEIDKSRIKLSDVSEELAAVSQRFERSRGDKGRLSELVEELEGKVLIESSKFSRARAAAVESDKKMEQYKRSFTGLETAEMQASVREKETKMYLDMQVEQNRELEARLEQALRRWKLEKEASSLETEKYIKMRSTSASLVEQLDSANNEVNLLNARLGQYDNLPLPVRPYSKQILHMWCMILLMHFIYLMCCY
jgi:serine/threonine protein kinase